MTGKRGRGTREDAGGSAPRPPPKGRWPSGLPFFRLTAGRDFIDEICFGRIRRERRPRRSADVPQRVHKRVMSQYVILSEARSAKRRISPRGLAAGIVRKVRNAGGNVATRRIRGDCDPRHCHRDCRNRTPPVRANRLAGRYVAAPTDTPTIFGESE